MNIKGDDLFFSSGKRIYANRGIIGINLDGDMYLSEGYDGSIPAFSDGNDGKHDLTPEECIEIADAMIERWRAYRAMCYKSLGSADNA